VSTSESQDDGTTDPATAQALPADADVAAGAGAAPAAETRVHDVPPPEGAVGARALEDEPQPGGDASSGGGGGIADKIPSSVTDKAGELAGKASGLTDKLPTETVQDRPELLVGGAFVGGFLVAKVLRRIAGV
jgi:hypothetical protein